jgi:hypothetical protein
LYLHATTAGVFCVPLVEESEGHNFYHGWLAPRQTIHVGPYEISAEIEDARAPLPATELFATFPAGASAPTLIVSYGGRQVERRELPRFLTIVGRRRPSTVRIRDPRISSCHCALYWDGEAMWAVDLLSGNGIGRSGRVVEATSVPAG